MSGAKENRAAEDFATHSIATLSDIERRCDIKRRHYAITCSCIFIKHEYLPLYISLNIGDEEMKNHEYNCPLLLW
jgi:hypothetical protein